jgi:DNA primase catalytic core
MEITEIKSRLSIETVLQYYKLRIDNNSRICCPFHADKTPSMQIYAQTNTAYCFSSNCKTHGKSMDVIDFIMLKDGITKHEAILKAQSLLGETPEATNNNLLMKEKITSVDTDFLERMFSYFRNGIQSSKPALDYLDSRCLDATKAEIGYNSGQFHHGERKSESLIVQCLESGLLLDKGLKSKTGDKAYSVFGNKCIVFPLRNKDNKIVSLYFRSTINNDSQKHYYLKNRSGLYPGYPNEQTKTLILTESIIDAASFTMTGPDTFVLACYGTNGLTGEHIEAIKSLPGLQEIVFAFDMDEAGLSAVIKLSAQLQTIKNCKISTLELPAKDINETLQSHTPEVFAHLLKERTSINLTSPEPDFLFSTESTEKEKVSTQLNPTAAPGLNTQNPDCLTYEANNLRITLWGGIDVYNVNRLRATLHIRLKDNEYRSFRDTVDLYSHTQSERLIKQASEKLEISATLLSEAITSLTAELETYRQEKREEYRRKEETKDVSQKDIFTKEQMQAASTLLNNKQLNKLTHDLFNGLGLVGQQDNAMLLFFIFLTRLFRKPLHAIVMGSSGSGKTHLLQGVAGTVPKQQIHYTTSLSENTLYYTPKDFLKHKVLLQEDLDGAYNALLPLRELMSNQSISRFSTKTNSRTGESKQVYLQVEGPVCIAGATTKERIYEDNANRSFLIQIEENPDHEREVLEYQGKIAAGQINTKSYEKNINILKAAQLQLHPMEVIIPFAESLDLPPHVFKKLRTKSHYLTLVKSLTLWNQRNRKKTNDEEGNPCLLSEVDDVRWANHLCRESLLRKSDELSGKTRNFFESLKSSQIVDGKQIPLFRAVDVRSRFRLHPMQLKRYLDELESRGLIRCKSRSHKTGNEYEILVWNDYEILQSGLDILQEIVMKLEKNIKKG